MNDTELRNARIKVLMEDFKISRDSAERVDDVSRAAAMKAMQTLMDTVQSELSDVFEFSLAVVAAQMLCDQTLEASIAINTSLIDLAKATAEALSLSYTEALSMVSQASDDVRGNPVKGDSCDCPACNLRRSIFGADRSADLDKRRGLDRRH